MTASESLSIGDVARRAGLRTSAIRYYESAGLLPRPARVSGRRCYERSIFTRLAVIALAREAGFSLNEIRRLTRASEERVAPGRPGATRKTGRARPGERWSELAREKLPQIEALIARAQAMRELLLRGMECDCASPKECPGVSARVRSMQER
jgi:MerR family redox-sensitive transcriptional activator SoxR